jgi:hypothetical protein
MKVRSVWAAPLLLAAVCAAQDAPRVRESQPRSRVDGDPVVNPSRSRPHPGLPARARAEGERGEAVRERTNWAAARWTRATLQLPGTTQKAIAVPAPATLLLRASWTGPPVAVTIVKQGITLATATPRRRFDGVMIATIQAKVPAAGEVVIRATESGSQPVKVDLYVGVLAAAR